VYKEDNKDDDDRIIMNTPIYVLISAVVAGLIFVGYQQWAYQPIDLGALAKQIDQELPIARQTADYKIEPLMVSADQQQIIAKQHLILQQGISADPARLTDHNQVYTQVFCQVIVAKVGLVKQMQHEQKFLVIKYYNAKGLMLESVTIQPKDCVA
jgi:hypothetical protein